MMNSIEYIDIVIVGAGFTGLSAAKYFSSKSIKSVIIEGRSRLGGRTLTKKICDDDDNNHLIIDLGGQWITENQKRIFSFIREYSIDLIEQTWFNENPNYLGQLIGLKPLNNEQLDIINQIYNQWDSMALEFENVENALLYEKSSQWDKISLKTFIEQNELVNDLRIKQELKLQILTLTACDCENVSLLYWLIFIRSIPGGLKTLDDGFNGAQQYKIKYGTESLCLKLANNQEIRFNEQLISVDYSLNDKILLKFNSNKQIICQRLLLAFSSTLISPIKFIPNIELDYLSSSMIAGQCIKTIFIYSKPYWKDRKINQSNKQGPCSNIFELKNPHGLIGLILGNDCSLWLNKNENELIQSIIEQYQLLYNINEKPLKTFIQYWPKESLSKGCYAAIYSPSLSSKWFHRNQSLINNRIWLASTESALEWITYIEGAIEAGQRFAQYIINSL
ncbi:unnamed protein product [Rotaria socialis]|uniref:Amine oxidase n=1 Tax=Rotaria socialis TaxID=392032 RepID=A0A817SX56_9BILA|nr:unnamed protein product [Rotaria socialis]CAF4694362.1 unnamed protein product [Rotaria socialis]